MVGVVSDVNYDGLDQPDQGTVYFAISRSAPSVILSCARKVIPPRSRADGARRSCASSSRARRCRNVATVDQLIDQSLVRPQSISVLVASFAGVALLLSIIGIYGVMGYYVQQHLKEISIRMALGGSRGDVAKLVVGQGMTVVIGGVIAGTALAFAATRLMSSLLFGVGATDPLAFTGVASLMVSVALIACAVPAWRAMRVQPAVVLRNE